MNALDRLQPYVIGALFIVAGGMHFKIPETYARIVPPYLPAHEELVAVSGVFEILGGVGAAIPATRKAAGIGLLALLVAVFPANLYMATDSEQFASFAPPWVFWARLPLQALLMLWVYGATVRAPKPS